LYFLVVLVIASLLVTHGSGASCLETTVYSNQIGDFLNWARTNLVPSDESWLLPSQTALFQYACTQAEDTGLHYGFAEDQYLHLWLRYFLGYNEFVSQLTNYAQPFLFLFLDETSGIYSGPGPAFPPITVSGGSNIVTSLQNQPYTVTWTNVVTESNMDTFIPNTYKLYYQAQKNLTLNGVGTVTGELTSHLFMTTVRQTSPYPLTVIRQMWDVYPELILVRWQGLCGAYCVDCTPGTQCSPVYFNF